MKENLLKCPICGTSLQDVAPVDNWVTCPFCDEKIKVEEPEHLESDLFSKEPPIEVKSGDSPEILTCKCPTCGSEIKYKAQDLPTTVKCDFCAEEITLSDNSTPSEEPPEISDNEPPPSSSYIIHIIDVLMQKGHRLLCIFFIVNMILAIGILHQVFVYFTMPVDLAFFLAIIIYVLSLLLVASPLGEFYFRFYLKCRTIRRREDINFITPLIEDTLAAARRVDPTLPQDITCFMSEDADINAFATGRRTICVTRGLLSCPPRYIQGILAHEMGHLSHRDTDIVMFIFVGNMIINAFFSFIRLVLFLVKLLLIFAGALFGAILGVAFNSNSNGAADSLGGLGSMIGDLLSMIWNKITELWTLICLWCQNHAGRHDEYRADEFSFNCGFGTDLRDALQMLLDIQESHSGPHNPGMLERLNSSHPPFADRIAHLEDMGADDDEPVTLNKLI